jgi:hypothetical protein
MDDLTTPVALFVYRRPEHTERVIERILEVEPPRVLVVGDGPADGGEEKRVKAVRRVVAEANWECEVRTNYADSNLGLKERFATGLDWVFGNEREAIILEDDTLPHPSFFTFCDTLLDRFRDDHRVWEITGRNEVPDHRSGDDSYFYSHYGGVWGWATWRSAYREYDPDMSAWEDPVVRDRIRDVLADRWQAAYISEFFSRTAEGEIETWDYQWGFARLRNNGVSVVPETNLVRNIGFGEGATNTTGAASSASFGGKSVNPINFPLSHPNYVGVDRSYDRRFHKQRRDRWRTYPILGAALDRAISYRDRLYALAE